MYNLGTSFELEDAIKDLKRIMQRTGMRIDESLLPHIAMDLVKAEQEFKKDKTLDHELTEMTNILNYPFDPLINSISHIGDAIDDLSESVAFLKGYKNPLIECPNCFAPVSDKYDVCPECGFTIKGSDTHD